MSANSPIEILSDDDVADTEDDADEDDTDEDDDGPPKDNVEVAGRDASEHAGREASIPMPHGDEHERDDEYFDDADVDDDDDDVNVDDDPPELLSISDLRARFDRLRRSGRDASECAGHRRRDRRRSRRRRRHEDADKDADDDHPPEDNVADACRKASEHTGREDSITMRHDADDDDDDPPEDNVEVAGRQASEHASPEASITMSPPSSAMPSSRAKVSASRTYRNQIQNYFEREPALIQ